MTETAAVYSHKLIDPGAEKMIRGLGCHVGPGRWDPPAQRQGSLSYTGKQASWPCIEKSKLDIVQVLILISAQPIEKVGMKSLQQCAGISLKSLSVCFYFSPSWECSGLRENLIHVG